MGRRLGFTLLELMLVLAIAAAMVAVVPPLLSAALPGLQLKSAARQVAAGFRATRSQAVTHHIEAVFDVDMERKVITWTGAQRALELPSRLDLELTTARVELADENRGSIRFFPDGTSTGGRLSLRYGDRGYRVDVDWLTGRVTLNDLETGG
jgi:general secretion pathway protein H